MQAHTHQQQLCTTLCADMIALTQQLDFLRDPDEEIIVPQSEIEFSKIFLACPFLILFFVVSRYQFSYSPLVVLCSMCTLAYVCARFVCFCMLAWVCIIEWGLAFLFQYD